MYVYGMCVCIYIYIYKGMSARRDRQQISHCPLPLNVKLQAMNTEQNNLYTESFGGRLGNSKCLDIVAPARLTAVLFPGFNRAPESPTSTLKFNRNRLQVKLRKIA